MDLFTLIMLFGGLTFFMYGMNVMSSNLEKISGGKLETLLRRVTSNPLIGLSLGAVITIAMQSSSAITVMLVGLVNSGIMQLSQTLSVIFGANIGTTLTAWILSLSGIQSDVFYIRLLKPEYFSLVFAFVGILYNMFSRNDRKKSIGTIFIGFAVLMYGMELMKDAMAPLSEMPEFSTALTTFSNPIVAVLISTAFTGIIQSSAASIGILQVLSASGGITYAMAIPIVMGQNIGTCVTALLSCIGTNKQAKRVAILHLSINLIGTIVILSLYSALDAIFHFAFTSMPVNSVSIAVIHTMFNIIATAFLLPAGKLIIRLAERIIPDREDEVKNIFSSLDDRLLMTPSIAVAECNQMMKKMAHIAHSSVVSAIELLFNYDAKTAEEIMHNEDLIDRYEDKLGNFLVKVSSKGLSQEDSLTIGKILHAIGDYERLSDHAVNLVENANEINDKQLKFSDEGSRELKILSEALLEILDISLRAITEDQSELATKVEPLEEAIDYIINEIKMLHVKRLQIGKCTIELGFVLSDILTNFERISDHCSNIAVAVIEADHVNFDSHEYLSIIKSIDNDTFNASFEEYRRRYAIE